MNKAILAIAAFGCTMASAFAQKAATVQTVVQAEDEFVKLAARKGIKEAFLTVTDPEGIVFKPDVIKTTDFYGKIDKQPGTLTWQPKYARISANGDLAFTAGPYVYQNGKTEDDKVYGDYVSIWKLDQISNRLKLVTNLGIQHPQSAAAQTTDIKEPVQTNKVATSVDPFKSKGVVLTTDRHFNQSLKISTVGTYKEFLTPEGRVYFPGFEPMVGVDKTLKFMANQAISITAETLNGGRASSNDLAYTYGRARIRKGNIVSNYYYVRLWEQDAQHRWNVILEILSAVENE